MSLLTEYMPYLLIGLGLGYLVSLGRSGPTTLDRQRHDLEVKKEWIRMLAKQASNSK